MKVICRDNMHVSWRFGIIFIIIQIKSSLEFYLEVIEVIISRETL